LKVHVATAVSTGRTFKNSVIVDTFRSSSTIIAALGNGVKAVIPYSTVGDALRARNATRNRSGVILVGERNGIMPKGFDCNVSPLDMTRERIGGKTILYSSSNLTRILGKLKARTRILVGGINCLLSDIAGNIFDMKILDNVKLLDLNFPKYWLEAYKGPKFGLAGTKKLAGIEKENRPVVGAITKPNVGLDAKTYAKLAYETALGGVDFIKDDEALVSPKYCPLEDRVSAVMEAIDRAKKQTGKETLYAVNITTRQDKLVELAERAIQAGANHLMVCGPYVGFGGMQVLAEDPSVKAPIHTHRVGHAAFTRNPKHGIDAALWSKLMRMCGADQLHIGSVEGKFYYDRLETQRTIAALRQPWLHIEPTMPVSSAGNRPGNIRVSIDTLGNDMMFLAGGGIHGHPDGLTAGARAMMAAVRAAVSGVSLKEAAGKNPELMRAVSVLELK
jgi:ribulose-bisphosphate carboxylase large chain